MDLKKIKERIFRNNRYSMFRSRLKQYHIARLSGQNMAGKPLKAATAEEPEELDKLIELGNKYLWSSSKVHKYLQDRGIILEPARFYSTIPLIKDIENAFEYSEDMPFALHDMFDVNKMKKIIKRLSKYSKEFNPPLDGNCNEPESFFWNNGLFSYSDAMSYYSMLRDVKPNVIVEIGSGYSTLVALEAIEQNNKGKIISIEPYPSAWLQNMEAITLIEKPAQSFDADFFNSNMSNGDVLFIDSTHTVKSGSDCLHLYLRVLPRLSRDLFIHMHDIFLPYGLPLEWGMERHIHWTEQYILLAYMINNQNCEVLFGSYFAQNKLPAELEQFMHGYYNSGGASFWIKHSPE